MNPGLSLIFNQVLTLFVLLNMTGPLLAQGPQGPPVITRQPVNDTTCIGGTAIFSVSATNVLGYEWFVDRNDGSGFTSLSYDTFHSGSTTSQLTVRSATANMNGYRYRCFVIGRGYYTSSQQARLVITATWTGRISVNWSDAGNWSCESVPAATSDVIITAGTPFMPVLNARGACRDLTIAAGASLTMGANQILQITGNMDNRGTFDGNATGSLIYYNSSAAQTIGTGTYNGLVITNGGLNSLAGNVTINGMLSLVSGKIATGNGLLTIGANGGISGGDGENYIITNGGPGSGIRKMNIGQGTGTFVFPIGASINSYTPVQLTNTGANDNFTTRVGDGIYTAYDNEVPTGTLMGSGVVNKTWYVSEDTPGGSDAGLWVQWNQADELLPLDRTTLTLSHYTNGRWSSMPGAVALPSTGSGPYTLARNHISSFSPFAVGNAGTVLPVTFSAIAAKMKGGALTVSWTTLNEVHNDHFEVEASADGKNFHALATVRSQVPGGNSDGSLEYHIVIDQANLLPVAVLGVLSLLSLAAGARRTKWIALVSMLTLGAIFGYGCVKGNREIDINQRKIYVRIAQVDKDGTRSFSKVILVNSHQ